MTNWNKQKFEKVFIQEILKQAQTIVKTDEHGNENPHIEISLSDGMWEAIEEMIREAYEAGQDSVSFYGSVNDLQYNISTDEYIEQLTKEEKVND